MSYKVFWWLSVLLMLGSYVTNGGFFGKLFRSFRNEVWADRLLFLAIGAMLCCAGAIMLQLGA